MQYATFKDYIKANYSLEELQDIAEHGCNGGVSGMIYYSETTDLYFQYGDDMHEIIAEYKANVGEMPMSIVEQLDDAVQFRNAIVWFATEYIAYELVNNTVED